MIPSLLPLHIDFSAPAMIFRTVHRGSLPVTKAALFLMLVLWHCFPCQQGYEHNHEAIMHEAQFQRKEMVCEVTIAADDGKLYCHVDVSCIPEG